MNMTSSSSSTSEGLERNRLSQLEMSLINKPKSKSSLKMRWQILASVCIAAMGVYYS